MGIGTVLTITRNFAKLNCCLVSYHVELTLVAGFESQLDLKFSNRDRLKQPLTFTSMVSFAKFQMSSIEALFKVKLKLLSSINS